MPPRFVLREPSLDLAASFEAFRDAALLNGDHAWTGRTALARENIPEFIELLRQRALGQAIPDGWVPETTYWITQGKIVVGDLEIRNPLNDWLSRIGGHIGYLTHPDHRKKGVATFALRKGLRLLAAMGVTEALLTCQTDNTTSMRVIEKCGGIRIEDATVEGFEPRRRYRIPL